jgi:hypothetical protein
VLIYIVPHYVLDAELVGWLTRHFADLRIYRAVDTQFKQVVIFGRRFASATRHRIRPRARCCCRSGKATPKPRSCQSNGRSCRTRCLPAAEPEHFYRVTMEPEQFADEVGRLQGLWPTLDTHLGAAQQSLRSPARALSHWHLALALAAGAISGVVKSKTGRVLVVKATPTRRRPADGIHRTRRRLRGRDAHPDRQVRAGHPCLGHDTRLADLRRGVDHPLIAVP